MRLNYLSRINIVMLMLVVLSMLLTGCGKGLSEADVAYAGPMLDSILEGIAARDYSQFTKDFSQKMKDAIQQDDFDELVATLDTKLGEYQARSFTSAAKTRTAAGDITIVTYQARYSKDGSVVIKMYFSGDNEHRSIEGFSIDSPALQE